MKILFLGNCQVSVFRDFCNYYLNRSAEYLNIVNDLQLENSIANNLISNCNICITQHFYSGKYYYDDAKILELLSDDAEVIYIHVLYYDGYFIDNERKFQNLTTPIDISILNILKTPYLFYLINEKNNNKVILEEINEKFSEKEIIQGSILSLQNLYERENGLNNKNPVDVKIYDYIEENYKKVKLFHTLNHPSNLLLNYYSIKICEYVSNRYDIELKPYNNDFDTGYEKLGSTTIPIYKKVYNILNLEFENIIYYKYKKYDLNSYIDLIRDSIAVE